jgi:hypothetical protein
MLVEIREHPPPMLKNIDGETLAGADGEPGVPAINARNIDGGPLGGADGDPGAPTINAEKCRWRAP